MLPWNLVVTTAFSFFFGIAHAQDLSSAGFVSIIDVLSESAQFSILIRQLQRHGLVPVLNEATNVTFIAPTNAAFVDVDPTSISRDQLLYHLLNQTIVLKTLNTDLVAPTYLYSSSLVYSTTNSKAEDYPLPIYVNNFDNTSYAVGNTLVVEQDLKASKGHGVVHAVDKLLEIPESVCEMLGRNDDATIFSKIFQMEFNCSMPMLPEYATVLVPLDSAFDQVNKVELDYLLSSWAKEDRRALLSRHIINTFIASPLIDDEINSTALDGTSLSFSDILTVNGSFEPTDINILASDGVLHFYDKFITGKEGNIHSLVDFTPEKYCLALGASHFVKELKFRGLRDLVTGHTDPQTVFVPLDDDDDVAQQESLSSTLYHFVHGTHNLDFETMLGSNILLETKSVHRKLGHGSQRIKVMADEKSHSIYLNGKEKILAGPYTVGNSTLFTIGESLDLPPSLDLAVGSVYHSSQSATYLNDLGLLDLPTGQGWTVLLPTTVAWTKLDLVQKYLESNETAMQGVFESLILSHPFYSDSSPLDSQTLGGTNVTLKIESSHKPNKDNVSTSESFDLLVDDIIFHVQTPNVLSSNGVVHSVSHVEIPENVKISPTDILSSVDARTFVELLKARNMSNVLDTNSSYTVLVPSDRALESSNITLDTPDIDILLRLHVIPGNPIDAFLKEGHNVESLEDGIHLTAKELNSGNYLISIVEGDTREIRVLNRGDVGTKNGSATTTILYVDRFLSPSWITHIIPPFKSPFRLKTPIAILLGMVFGAILIFSVFSCALFVFLRRNNKNESKQVSGSTSPSDTRIGSPDLERRPLISRKSSALSNRGSLTEDPVDPTAPDYGSTSRGRRSSVRSLTSEHSISEPIPAIQVQKDREHGRHLGLPRALG